MGNEEKNEMGGAHVVRHRNLDQYSFKNSDWLLASRLTILRKIPVLYTFINAAHCRKLGDM